MTFNQAIYREMVKQITRKPRSLKHCMDDFAGLWSDQQWGEEQVRLFIACCPDLGLEETKSGKCMVRAIKTYVTPELGDAIYEVLESVGPYISLDQIKNKLPKEFVTTKEKIIDEIKTHPEMEVFGPGLIRRKP